ncbi:hypothetical protein N6L26_06115 [Qipengyuania sp. SS22]|uniref:hypothetical protein n=1 Tax=Qipengyuania sp. SS22 TaxID=2979461 RepID=UPI0021E54599|nr:hypothetical protein [Qipengyuania sp. SS22]UYH56125.1 hypothetical protein N6L26_06115 [Qipengyuania sp. SS22]
MSDVILHVFDSLEEAKNCFATIANSSELHGAITTSSGMLYQKVGDNISEVVGTNKFYVLETGANVVSD